MRRFFFGAWTFLALVTFWTANARAAEEGLAGIVAPGAKPELVQEGFQFTEGPVSAPDGTLYFSDVRANRIYRLGSDGKAVIFRENSGGANGLALDRAGRLVAVEGGNARIVAITPDGAVMPLAEKSGDKPFIRPNDLILDANGGIYFTDPGPRPMPGLPAAQKPAVYYVRPGGEAVLVNSDITRPNGITLSLDGKTLLVADSLGEDVVAFDVQPDGTLKNRRPFARLRDVMKTATGVQSGADGMAVDRQGRLYVTSSTGIQVFDAKSVYLGTIAVPKKPSNLAFGGQDRKTLYITAGDSLFRLQMAALGPEGRAK
jgi:gluconolactonase